MLDCHYILKPNCDTRCFQPGLLQRSRQKGMHSHSNQTKSPNKSGVLTPCSVSECRETLISRQRFCIAQIEVDYRNRTKLGRAAQYDLSVFLYPTMEAVTCGKHHRRLHTKNCIVFVINWHSLLVSQCWMTSEKRERERGCITTRFVSLILKYEAWPKSCKSGWSQSSRKTNFYAILINPIVMTDLFFIFFVYFCKKMTSSMRRRGDTKESVNTINNMAIVGC